MLRRLTNAQDIRTFDFAIVVIVDENFRGDPYAELFAVLRRHCGGAWGKRGERNGQCGEGAKERWDRQTTWK